MRFLIFYFTLCLSTFAHSKDVHVKGYTKSNGTYVEPHYRSSPDGIHDNNWSVIGNTNPYTGKIGEIDRIGDGEVSYDYSYQYNDSSSDSIRDYKIYESKIRHEGDGVYFVGYNLESGEEVYLNTKNNSVTYIIDSKKVSSYVSKQVITCAKIAQIKEFKSGLYLNLDFSYPNQSVTLVAWERSLKSIGKDNILALRNKIVCASGVVSEYNGMYQININDIESFTSL